MNSELFEKGLQVRREVLGAEYVDASISQADDFSRPLQELVTEYCWGAVWTRPGLDRKTRSLLNLAMLTALNRPHEVKLHLKGALNTMAAARTISWRFSSRPPFIVVLRRQWTAFVWPKKPLRNSSPNKSDDGKIKKNRFYWFGQHGISYGITARRGRLFIVGLRHQK